MRRALHALTAASAAAIATLAFATPSWAEGTFSWEDSNGSGTATATDPGRAPSSTPGTVRVDNAPKTRVDNYTSVSVGSYTSGDPQATATKPPLDPTRPIYSTMNRTSNSAPGQRTGPMTAMIEGGSAPAAAPTTPATPAPAAPGAPAPQIDPGVLAQQAVSQMTLEAPRIASTPDDPDTMGAVGLPVWFWVDNPGPTTTGPNSTTATAGSVSVTATAMFTGLTIDNGDGTTTRCHGPGTRYPGKGIYESPTCGHTYMKMSRDLYTVTTTAHWEITWTSNTGAGGTIPVDLTSTKQLRIGQYETVVTSVR